MKNDGLILQEFPWTTYSIWNKAFFDKDWLFHVYLIPFLSLGKLFGGKIAILSTVFFSGITWGYLIKTLRIRYIFITLLLILFSTQTAFLGRLIFCRGHLLSILIFPLCLVVLIKNKKFLLLFVTYIYCLAYTGSWQIFIIAILFDIVTFRKSKKLKITNLMTIWCLTGIILGFIINPYFPANIYGGIIQNIMVMKARWFGVSQNAIIQGLELYPMPLYKLFTIFLPIIIINIYTFIKVLKIKTYTGQKVVLLFFGLLSIIYLLITVVILKFTDYYVPIAITFIALYWHDKIFILHRYIKLILLIIIYSLLALSAYRSIKQIRHDTYRDKIPFSSVSKWLKNHLMKKDAEKTKPQKLIFTSSWDNTPYLFYNLPEFKYIVMLDPYFMYSYSPEKYKLWEKIKEGKTLNPSLAILKTFKTNIVLVTKNKYRLIKQLLDSPYAKLVYINNNGVRIFILKNNS
ncbi:MAG: hypothetical protein GY756_08535 [bacterium]|nr:hypothetical protein [bacterium]